MVPSPLGNTTPGQAGYKILDWGAGLGLWEVMATIICRSQLQWEQSMETWGYPRPADSKGICERDSLQHLKFLIEK